MFGVAALLPAQNISIEGVVVNVRLRAEGVGGATVVYAPGQMVLTDEAGVFRGTVAKPGDYSGYVAKQQGYLEDLVQFRFHVSADGSPVRPRVELTPPAILRGRVLGVDGKPARATVELGPKYSARTDDDGYFTIDRLPPGSFILLARPEAAEPVSTQEGLRTEAAPTYHPSTLERAQAESITIRAGADLSGYEIRLQSAPVYRLSGVVFDLDGNPARDAVVQLLDKVGDVVSEYTGGPAVFAIKPSSSAETPSPTQSTSTGDDGTFEFPSVRPGDWIVRVESDSVRDEIQQRDGSSFRQRDDQPGPAGDLDDVRIRLRMPFDLSGTVDGGNVTVALTGETGYFGGTARSDANGALRFEGIIPGRYQISAQAGGNYYASVLLGSSEVTGQTVELTASSPPMRVVLRHGGTVRWAPDQSGSWTVVLLPQRLMGFGYSAPSQASQLTGIPPGEYYAIALDRFDPRTRSDSAHLREFVPRATSVRVEEGSDAFVELKINHAPD